MALIDVGYKTHKRKFTMIKPTIGRVVLVQNAISEPGEQATPALICFVYHDRLVNLANFTAGGKHRAMEQVQLVQEGDAKPTTGYYAEWMPFQVGQAKAHAAVESASKSAKQAPVPGAIDDRADDINDMNKQRDSDVPTA